MHSIPPQPSSKWLTILILYYIAFPRCVIMKLSVQTPLNLHSAPVLDHSSPSNRNQNPTDELSESEEGKSAQLIKEQNKQKNVIYQPTIICNLSDTRYPVVRRACKKLGMKIDKKESDCNNWDLLWTDNAVQPEELGKMSAHQKINHFPGMFCLSRKNHLGRNLMKMRKKFPQDYNFFPLTWMFPSQRSQLRAYAEKHKKNHTFIVKPQASCQGRGIFLVKNIEDIPHGQHYVVQKYLNKPFLIDNLKFDFRIYVLLAGCSPMRIYVYQEGLARFATEEYTTPTKDNIEISYMHLTNYAINKGNDKFVYNETDKDMTQGHKRSLTSTMKAIQEMGHNSKQLWAKIKDMIIKAIISGQPILSHHYRSCQPENLANNMCFQILGLDVILDHQCNPYLLQVNYTPSFTTDTPLDRTIKLNLIKDTIQLMNVTSKAKRKIQTDNKQILMKRMLSGKKQKLTSQERQQMIKEAQRRRDKWEDKHLGGFQKIYPLPQNDPKYEQFLSYSQECYLEQTGANIRRNSKKEKQLVPNPKRQTTTEQLSKIYNKPLRPRTAVKKVEVLSKRQRSEIKIEPMDKIANKTIDERRLQSFRQFKTTLYQKRLLEVAIMKIQPPTVKRNTGKYLQPQLFHLGFLHRQ